MPWWLLAVATLGWVMVAAKAHGRQVRVEREQQGVFHVDFGGQNPDSVEQIWRRDRRLFWPCMAVLSVLIAGNALVAGQRAVAVLALPVAFALAFMVAGIASWVRMALRRQGPLPWRRRVLWGSVAWWLATMAAAALFAWAAAAG